MWHHRTRTKAIFFNVGECIGCSCPQMNAHCIQSQKFWRCHHRSTHKLIRMHLPVSFAMFMKSSAGRKILIHNTGDCGQDQNCIFNSTAKIWMVNGQESFDIMKASGRLGQKSMHIGVLEVVQYCKRPQWSFMIDCRNCGSWVHTSFGFNGGYGRRSSFPDQFDIQQEVTGSAGL